jgi:hypothetical protein
MRHIAESILPNEYPLEVRHIAESILPYEDPLEETGDIAESILKNVYCLKDKEDI